MRVVRKIDLSRHLLWLPRLYLHLLLVEMSLKALDHIIDLLTPNLWNHVQSLLALQLLSMSFALCNLSHHDSEQGLLIWDFLWALSWLLTHSGALSPDIKKARAQSTSPSGLTSIGDFWTTCPVRPNSLLAFEWSLPATTRLRHASLEVYLFKLPLTFLFKELLLVDG